MFDTEAQARCPGAGACVFVAKIRGTCVFKILGLLEMSDEIKPLENVCVCVCVCAQHVSKFFWNFLHALCGPSASSLLAAQWSWLPDFRGASRRLHTLTAALWGGSPARAPCLEAGSSSGRPEVTLQGWPSHPRSLLLAHKFGGPPVSHSVWRFQVKTRGIRQITPQGEAAKQKDTTSILPTT